MMPSAITSFTLTNGLRILVHSVPKSNMAVFNMVYFVGARYENPKATGLAHLLEHTASIGSQYIPSYDQVLHQVGAESNAYTTNDVTSYWCKLPVNQLATAFWIEADRLGDFSCSEEALATQRKVVTEEFKQVYINKPYGDLWHTILNLSYKKHPYQWPTIGASLEHIAAHTKASLSAFHQRFYRPKQAVLVVVGGVTPDTIYQYAEQWLAGIKREDCPLPGLPQEAPQSEPRYAEMSSRIRVPQDAIYKTYPVPGRTSKDYLLLQLLCNYLTHGQESLLVKELVEERQCFSEITSYLTSTIDPGLLVIEGKLQGHITLQQGEKALTALLDQVINRKIPEEALTRAKYQEEADFLFTKADPIEQADIHAYALLYGNISFFEQEIKRLPAIQSADLQAVAATTLHPKNSNTLYYYKDGTH